MKSIVETIESINEARSLEYRVSFIGVNDEDGEPMTITVTLDNKSQVKPFEKYLTDGVGDTIYHANGGPNNFEI